MILSSLVHVNVVYYTLFLDVLVVIRSRTSVIRQVNRLDKGVRFEVVMDGGDVNLLAKTPGKYFL